MPCKDLRDSRRREDRLKSLDRFNQEFFRMYGWRKILISGTKGKRFIDSFSSGSPCYPREIWWCSIGLNIGHEQDGKEKDFTRPVLIIKEFNKDIFLCVPLIGKKKEGYYYFPLGIIDDREASAVLSQIRLMDNRRLTTKITTLDQGTFSKIKSALRRALFDEFTLPDNNENNQA